MPAVPGALSGEGKEEDEAFPLDPLQPAALSSAGAHDGVRVDRRGGDLGGGQPAVPVGAWWWLFVAAAVGCMWISLSSAIRRRHNIPKNILWQVVILSLIAVAWDFLTHWRGWSIEYAIPAVCVFAMAAVSGCALFMKQRLEEFMIYLILDGLLGLAPLIFLLLGWLRVIYPSVICVSVSILSLAALFSFAPDELKTELKKRLHL
jgi:hypothetical protein